ncbi:hypothetical protein CALCODRAFT_363305 [Calocera cornea HHB12733]|uniref:RanBP2-type domain-containing protein n=1 Tax=Calocera cornea HHB12733 TaxID=1353952 RepID=A0A165EKG7_9BASI|nr:hypothetical protein CALCODRAFT_363305 [Calocera cornea HHB12733]
MSSEGRKRKRPVPSGAGASGTGSGSRRAWNPPNATKHDDDETVEIEFAGARSAKDIAEQKERQREEMKRRLKKRQVIDLTALPVIEVIDLSKSSDDDDVPAPPPKRPRPSNSSNVSNPTVYRESTVIDISDGEPEPTPRPRRAMERARNAARKSVVLDAVVNGEPSSSSAAQLAQATDPPMLTPPPTSFTRPWALPLPSDAPVVPAPSPSHDRISPQIVDRDAPRLQFPTPGPSSPTNTRDQLPPSSSNLHVTITSATPDRAPSGLAFPANNEHRRLLDYSVTYPPEPTDQVEASAFALGPLRSLSVLPDSQPPSPAVDEDSPISTAALGLVARQMPVLPDSHEQEVQGGTTALGAVALRTSVLPDSQDASPMTALGLVTLRTTVLPDSQAPSPEPPSDNVITDELINARALTVQLPDSLDTVEALADDLPASEIFVSHLVSSVLADSQGDALVDLEDVTMDLAFVPFDRLPNSPKDELDELDEDLPATPIDAPLALQESGVEDLRDQEEDELDYDSYEVVESPEGESENDLDEAWEGEEEEEEEEEVDELFDEDEDLPARTSGRVALSLNGCKTSTSPSEDQPTADNEVQEGRHRPIESRGSSVSDLKTAEGFRMPDEFVAMAEQSDLRLREAVEGLTQGLTRVTAGALRWVTERVAGRVDGIEADDQLLDDDDVEDKQDSGAGLTTPAPLLRTTDSSPVIDVTTEGHAIPDSTDREEDRVLMPLVRSPAVSSLRQELGTDRYSAHQSTINVSEGPLSMVPAKERLRNEPTPPPPDHTDRPLSSQSSSLFSGLPTSRLQTWQPSSEDPDGWVCLESACGFTNHSTARRCRDCNAKRMAQPTVKNPKSCLDAKCPHGPFTSAVKYLGHIRFCNNSRPNRLSTVPPPAMPSAQSPTHSTSRHNASPATVRDHPPQQKQKDRPADVLVGVPSRRALPEQDHGIAVSPNPRSSESSSDISKADSILDDLETRPRATVDSLDTTPDPKVDERDHNDAILMGRTSSLSPVPVEPQNCHTTELSDDEEKDSLEADHMREESFDKAAENGTAQIETSPPPRPVGHSPLHQILASSSGDRSSSDNLISSPVTPITPSGVQIPPSAQSPPADGSSSTESSSRPQTLRMTITRKRKWDSVDAIDIALPIMPLVRRPTSPLRVAIPPSRVVIPSESHGTVPRPFVIPSSRVVIPSETNGSVPRPASVSQSPVEPGHSPLERTENPVTTRNAFSR